MFAEDDTTHDFTRDAGNAVRLFNGTFPEFHVSSETLLDPLIRYFISSFRLNIDRDVLPTTVHKRRRNKRAFAARLSTS